MDRLITRLRSSGLSWGNISSFDPATISREIIGVLLRLGPAVCVQGIAPHNHRGDGELTCIIARCCPSCPKIASISRERPRAPPERSGRQLARHGGSSRRERERRGRERERGIAGRTRKNTPDQRETTDGPAECTCWNKGLANRRRRWKLKRTRARVQKRTRTGSRVYNHCPFPWRLY